MLGRYTSTPDLLRWDDSPLLWDTPFLGSLSKGHDINELVLSLSAILSLELEPTSFGIPWYNKEHLKPPALCTE